MSTVKPSVKGGSHLNFPYNRADLSGVMSPLIHVGQFKLDAAQVVNDYHMDVSREMSNDPDVIAKDLNTDATIAKELMEVCSPARLTCPRDDEICDWEDLKEVPLDTGLDTIRNWLHLNKARLENKLPTNILKSKYTEYDCNVENGWIGVPAKDESDRIRCPESVITVAVNFPRTSRRFKHSAINFRVLGSQNLTELRDTIPCTLDQQPIGKYTEDPFLPQDIVCKDLFKAGHFFIENTFYHDHRVESSVNDLSKPILAHAKENDIEIPENVREVNMEDFTFDDLNLCLGCPYLYVHQGNCEHIMIFKDIRLLHPMDCMSRSSYPIAMSRSRTKSEACKVCDHLHAKWMTTNDELSDQNPSFFCDPCFKMLHYNKDGTRACNFEAFPYVPREALLY